MNDSPKSLPEKASTSPDISHSASSGKEETDDSTQEKDEGWWNKIDQTLLSTIALTFISFCALFVSIYQTRVLSLQQEVMAEQQRIMTENAKAQLWPNVEVGLAEGYDGNTIEELEILVSNTGTGPAIVEGVTVQYNGKYADGWWNLWSHANLPDSIPRTISNEALNGGVIQVGERVTFLSLKGNLPLMEFLMKDINNKTGPTITVCYKSVFDDYWQIETALQPLDSKRATSVESCTVPDSITFYN